jgi:hypothetical protein
MKSPQIHNGPTDGDVQLGLGLKVPSRPLRLSRDLRDIPVDKYRLPKDGRKWKRVAGQRMSSAQWLATYADPDGSRIFVSEATTTRHFGWSRRTTFRLLADLRELGLLEGCGLTSEHGTRVRRMNLEAFLGAGVPNSAGAGVPGSRAGVPRRVAHNRPLTDQSQNQNLRPLARPSSPPSCGKLKNKKPATPQQRNFGIVGRLTKAGVEILERNPGLSYPDLAEELKQWASDHYVPVHTLAGAASPIVQAIDNAYERIKRRKTA